jgi:hypothetical protein
LSGAVLFDPEFVESWKRSQKGIEVIEEYIKQTLPLPIKESLRKLGLRGKG